jgi:hypothetical protein
MLRPLGDRGRLAPFPWEGGGRGERKAQETYHDKCDTVGDPFIVSLAVFIFLRMMRDEISRKKNINTSVRRNVMMGDSNIARIKKLTPARLNISIQRSLAYTNSLTNLINGKFIGVIHLKS